jgi:acetylornithine deacetylase/succinyl-diaminopimelate desuccinylase-like protein
MAHPDLSPEQRAWFESAASLIDIDTLYRLNREITAIHSPTGRERAASEHMTRYLSGIGLEASYQPMGEASGNAIGRMRGSGGGPSLLLYAPIDTHLDATGDDVPWVGPRLRADMIPQVREQDGLIIGLGASNPKAMVTTLAEAARVVRAAKVPLKGDLLVAYAGGGMPVDLAAAGNRGLSDGVSHLLARGVHTDFALVMKPGNAVYHEEAGLCWFKVSVKGTLGYAGMPHGLPRFRNSIAPAARVIL